MKFTFAIIAAASILSFGMIALHKDPEPIPPIKSAPPELFDPTTLAAGPDVAPTASGPRKAERISPRVTLSFPGIEEAFLVGVKHFEGFRSTRYVCSGGAPTIGFGCTDPKIVNAGPITRAKAEKVLLAELALAEGHVDRIVEVPLTKAERLALISFTFNAGQGALAALVDKPGRLNDGNRASIAKILPLYRKAGGKVAPGLVAPGEPACNRQG